LVSSSLKALKDFIANMRPPHGVVPEIPSPLAGTVYFMLDGATLRPVMIEFHHSVLIDL
jgi:hypothetical protein